MAGHLFSPRSHFVATQARQAKYANTTTINPNNQTRGSKTALSQHKTVTPQPVVSISEIAENKDGESNARIASLNNRITQLKRQLEAPTHNSTSNRTTKLAKKCPIPPPNAQPTSHQHRLKAINSPLNTKQQLEGHRYGRVNLQFQLFAEWTMTAKQRRRYRERLERGG